MTRDREPEINISKIPVAGVGGLGMVVMAGGVAYSIPALRWLAFIALFGGVVTGLALLISRHPGVRRTAAVVMALMTVTLLGAVIVHALS